jgi:hypothetical protein
MSKNRGSWVLACALLLGLGCEVESTGKDTGGVPDGAAGASGAGEEAAGAAGEGTAADCPRGVTVVLSDYVSTQVALSNLEGKTESQSFLSTASSETAGLAFALSGDVVVPSTAPASGRVVLLDRFGTNVVTWVDPHTAKVLGQLAVGTGFESNPQDYVEVDERYAWVSRWGQNADPGHQNHDSGGDLLIIDTERHKIAGSLVIEPEDDLPPRPNGLTFTGKEVVVALERIAMDWASTGDAQLVGFSVAKKKQSWKLKLDGLKACGRAVPFEDGARWLVACSGAIGADGTVESLDQSALVILDATDSPPREIERIQAADIAGEPLQNTAVFAGPELVLLKTQTPLGGSTNNRWLAYDLEHRTAKTLLEARRDADGEGKGLMYGGIVCAPGCSDLCLMADADRGVLERVRVDKQGALELLDPIRVEDTVGLPPRALTLR